MPIQTEHPNRTRSNAKGRFAALLLFAGVITGCATPPPYQPMSPQEVDAFVADLQANQPDLRQRVMVAAHRQLGQPYDIYLLGEFPFEIDDPQPLYQLEKSDCVVFVEHTYAMALSRNWAEFFGYLQRIRYIDGRIGVATRNHYTEPQWNPNNHWLVEDVTADVAGETAVTFVAKANVAKFLRNRFDKQLDEWIIEQETAYLSHEHFGLVHAAVAAGQLRDGDLVQIVRGTPPTPKQTTGEDGRYAGAYVGHFGLLEVDDAGTPWFVHSGSPEVRRERLRDYGDRATARNAQRAAEGRPQFLGFKFLALQDDPATNLRAIDGEHAPVVTYAPNLPLPRER
ncbi:MAG: N-acetylmuramoyl-L-alanine amidase-like domain-containing protein [Planctomycetota bacterium]